MDFRSETTVRAGNRPPRPRFALSVGIIGHRPKRLPKETETVELARVTTDVEDVLDAIAAAAQQAHRDHRSLFAEGEPVLTMVSALAEGADTIAAKAALVRHYKLDVPLPFPVKEYVKDFQYTPGRPGDPDGMSKEEAERRTKLASEDFNALLPQARSVLELPGMRRSAGDTAEAGKIKENRAYEAAGLTVLSQSDIILAVWDGGPSQGRGGTTELITEAARTGVPIIVIDANGVKAPELRWRNLMSVPAPIAAVDDLPPREIQAGIAQVVDELVRLPAAPAQQEAFRKWLEERERKRNFRIGFPALMAALLVRWPRVTDFSVRSHRGLVADFEKLVPKDLVLSSTEVKGAARAGRVLSNAYAWADAVAIWCAQIFRGAFIMNFAFAALAVVAASVGAMFLLDDANLPSSWQLFFIAAEILLISCVIGNTILGRTWRWHRRWVEAREMAERLRIALPLWVLGLRPDSFPGEEATWTGWYVRAFVRMQGLRGGNFASDQYHMAREVLLGVLESQCEYNDSNAKRMHKLERRLEFVGLALLIATFAVAADHLFHTGALESLLTRMKPEWGGSAHAVAVWLGAALPALATASYGIRVIGDLEGITRRAERTHKGLEQLIRAVKQDPQDLTRLRARARSAADIMLGDVSSWRLSAESRGLAIPG